MKVETQPLAISGACTGQPVGNFISHSFMLSFSFQKLSPIRVKRYCDGGYQLNLLSPVLCALCVFKLKGAFKVILFYFVS